VYSFPNGSGRTEKGRNKMTTTPETVDLAINPIQLELIKMALELEIRTYGGTRMRMTAEPALSIFARLIGEPAGYPKFRGLKGREQALDIVNFFLEQLEDGTAKEI
jgi:hypothetical protein